jgi:hypothetical protein
MSYQIPQHSIEQLACQHTPQNVTDESMLTISQEIAAQYSDLVIDPWLERPLADTATELEEMFNRATGLIRRQAVSVSSDDIEEALLWHMRSKEFSEYDSSFSSAISLTAMSFLCYLRAKYHGDRSTKPEDWYCRVLEPDEDRLAA